MKLMGQTASIRTLQQNHIQVEWRIGEFRPGPITRNRRHFNLFLSNLRLNGRIPKANLS